MNADTQNLIERPFQEIVDDILTSIVGGVVNEPILFDLKQFDYRLAEPAQDIRGITGIVKDVGRQTFQKNIDFEFSTDENAVIWTGDGQLPEDETTFYVDYFRQDSRSPITDINVGSVTRILGESIGREIKTVYEQINLAYLSGFVDTATGKALDLVVSILDVKRKTKDFATGLVSFFRSPESTGSITIPQGTVLTTAEDAIRFETTEPRTLQRGQVRIDVPVRAGEDFKGDVGKVPSGAITTALQPIEGVSRITNFDETILSAEDESDAQLRLRAKAVLRALGKGTIAAITRVIRENVREPENPEFLEIRDPNSAPRVKTNPGEMVLIIQAEPEQVRGLRGPINETRSAGILTTIIAKYIFFKPRILVELTASLTAPGKEKLKNEIIAAFQAYVDSLGNGQNAVAEELLDADEVKEVISNNSIKEIRFLDVLAFRSNLAQPGTEPLVNQLAEAVTALPAGDDEALKTELQRILEENPPPDASGRRIPDRSVIVNDAGDRATDKDIEDAAFSIVAQIEGEEGWIVLDMDLVDILLTGGE